MFLQLIWTPWASEDLEDIFITPRCFVFVVIMIKRYGYLDVAVEFDYDRY